MEEVEAYFSKSVFVLEWFLPGHRLSGVVVERPPQEWEVASSIPGGVIPKTLKMVVVAALLGAQGCGVSITTDWLVSG